MRKKTVSRRSPRKKKIKRGRLKTLSSFFSGSQLEVLKWAGMFFGFFLAAAGVFFLHQRFQPETLWTGFFLVLAGSGLWIWRFHSFSNEKTLENVPRFGLNEGIAFLFVFLVAVFWRIYRILEVPSGLFIDTGFQGYSALRILHEGWHPPYYLSEPYSKSTLPLYVLALWLKIFDEGKAGIISFFVTVSVMVFPFAYWTFREWMKPLAALTALFFLALMRWHWNFSRNCHPGTLSLFFMLATAAFFLLGMRTAKKRWFILGGLFFGMGAYTYQIYKVFPLLVFLWITYEAFFHGALFKKRIKGIGLFLAIGFCIALPEILFWMKRGTLGEREAQIFILKQIDAESLRFLWENIKRTFLMFHRFGDENARHNIPGWPMLDPVTGLFFALGSFLALYHWKKRWGFYPLAGLVVMSLPAVLAPEHPHAARMLGATPFIAALGALPVFLIVEEWSKNKQESIVQKGITIFLFVLSLAVMQAANFKAYFIQHGKNNTAYHWYDRPENWIAEKILEHGKGWEAHVSAQYEDHYTLKFMVYRFLSHIHRFLLPGGEFPARTGEKGLLFFLPPQKKAALDYLQKLYPKGEVEEAYDLERQVYMVLFRVPAESLPSLRGLWAFRGREKQIVPFPPVEPLTDFERYTGGIFIQDHGAYRFRMEPSQGWHGRIAGMALSPDRTIRLARGFYEVHFTRVNDQAGPLQGVWLQKNNGPMILIAADRWLPFFGYRGLLGMHWNGTRFEGEPLVIQWEPFLNITNGNDFPFTMYPKRSVWRAEVTFPQTGRYGFRLMTTDADAKMLIDGKEILSWGKNPSGETFLGAGEHEVEIYWASDGGFPMMSFYWKPPNAGWEVVPHDVFGPTKAEWIFPKDISKTTVP